MNKVKGSYFLKLIIHFILFLTGMFLLIGNYHIFRYLDSYSANIANFLETSDFQSKYLKYVERVAVYVDYKERGFFGNLTYDSTDFNIADLFVENYIEKSNKKELLFQAESQADFDYYNMVLNKENKNFIYYVKNLQTGVVYCSKNLENTLIGRDNSTEALEAYLNATENNPAYLIINTKTEAYFTNVNRNYHFLNDENLKWVMNRINGNDLTQEDPRSSRNEYIICTSIDPGFSNKNDEFGVMSQQFNTSYRNYKRSIYPVITAFVVYLLLLGLSIAFTGYKKEEEKIILNPFDQLYTEIGFILSVGGIFLLFLASKYCNRYLSQKIYIEDIYLFLIFFFLMYPFSMFCFMSLIKRFKANVLFTRSLTYLLIKNSILFFKNFITHRGLTFQLLFLLSGFAATQFAGIYLYHKPLFFDGWKEFIVLIILGYILLIYTLSKVAIDFNIIQNETKKIRDGNLTHKISLEHLCSPARTLGQYINNISYGLSEAVDEKLKSERLKTELIANVSHDIKTPLTSIINYVDLLKKEKLENETAINYLEILSSKSWRLKTLIEDLVEASKASSGTISLNLECLNLVELMRQSIGEFEDRLLSHNLETILNITEEPIYILADGRSTYRIIENIFSNVYKYALQGTRVYVDIITDETTVSVSIKNISASKLNINSDELMERFVRGDLSRNTEGSGLGLSISKSLAALQNASFDIILDGDLFKVLVKFEKLRQ